MASTPKFIPLLFMLLFCMLLIQETSECSYGHGCFYAKAAVQEIENRKVLFKRTPTNVHGLTNSNGYGGESLEDGWELRKVPSGPDPLHHNGASPKNKKPRTP